MCTDRHGDDDNDAIENCRISGSVELLTNIDIRWKTETCIMSESVELLTQIDKAEGRDTLEDAFLGRPELAKSNGLFAQIAFGHQHMTKFKSRKTLICERVLHNLDTPPPGVQFWRTEVRFVLCIT